VNLPAGQQTLRIVTTNANGGWNINWWEILASGGSTTEPAPAPSPSVSSIKIEAETYSNMSGIQTEPTSDAGGGLNVGWQDNNDWMDYSVNLASAGTYTVNFRVASYFTGAQFQLRNSSGAVLTTVTVPNTGGFQKWQTTSASVSLPAGQQTLRIVTTNANGGWNINWWEITTNATTTQKVMASQEETTAVNNQQVEIFPNPVINQMILKLNNAYSGNLKVEVVNMQGMTRKTVNLVKQPGTNQFYLSLGDLPAGQYIIRLIMTEWTESRMIIKQ
jgi:5-hydroxyisourate hydrolase-like protein (transthyretin family)